MNNETTGALKAARTPESESLRRVPLSIRLSPYVWDRLLQEADVEGVGYSMMVERLLKRAWRGGSRANTSEARP